MLLLAALSFQSPEKLGLSAAKAEPARAARIRTLVSKDFMNTS
jgi:hypothetical protein